MIERQVVRFLRRGERDQAVLFSELGERPLQSLLNGVLTAEGSLARASANSTSTAPPILTARMPILEIFKEGRRPLRDMTSQLITTLYQPQGPDPDTLKREEEAKAKAEKEDKRAAAYSAIENSVIIAG